LKSKGIEKVLVTGGCGFIGSHTVDLLIGKGYEVTILDNLEPQVHRGKVPIYLNKNAKLIKGDVRDRELILTLVREADAIIHLAAVVGVWQSMYQLNKYLDYNTRGTATLLDVLVNEENDVKKLVVASSIAVYGEGKYHCEKCNETKYSGPRNEEQLKNRVWDPPCPDCGTFLKSLPTDESKPLMPTSIYAMSKRHQEEMCLLIGKTYGIPTVVLRYSNVYGPRQTIFNPYTGAAAIFASRILNNKPPYLFEDGNQLRDYIHVKDVANVNAQVLKSSSVDYQAINIGVGQATSIRRLAELLIEIYRVKLEPHISQRYRRGDVRHCYPDIGKAQRLLNYKPSVSIEQGLRELAQWGKAHGWGAVDFFEKALEGLE